LEDDELALALVAVALCGFDYNVRRFWVDARSIHWIHCVAEGVLLQEEAFQELFRMNRNSFEILHGLLGIYQDQVKLML